MYALHTDTQMHVHRFINKKPKKKVYSCPQVVSGYIKYASNEQEDCPGLTPGYIDWTNVITQQHQKYNSSLTHTHTHTHTILHSLISQHHDCQQNDHPLNCIIIVYTY